MKRVCVYCGSSEGARPEYVQAARELGRSLARRGLGLVYGGARVGTMGAVADGALEAGGEVIGVIPHGLTALEVAHDSLSELHAVRSMHERKALMEELSDAFVSLPGSYGTHDETFEILVWLQLGIHRKPIGLLNVLGYYDLLLAHLDHARREGFLKPENQALLLVEDDAETLLDRVTTWVPPDIPRWVPDAPGT